MDRATGHGRPGFSRDHYPGVPPVALLGIVAVMGTYIASHRQPDARPFDALALGLLLVGAIALLGASRHIVAVLGLTAGTTAVYYGLGYASGPAFLAALVALILAVRAGRRSVAWAIVLVAWVLDLVVAAGPAGRGLHWRTISSHTFFVVGALVAAEFLRIRRQSFIEQRRARVETQRRRDTEERLLVARELHDVLAHSVSLINVQASTALHLFDSEPQRARTALATIKEVSHDTLDELRATLGALRGTDEEVPRAPTAGLGRLDQLVTQSAAVGLDVIVVRRGLEGPLPARTDLAAYRIVQEALTNVRRHSKATRADVGLDASGAYVVVRVVDSGPARAERRGRADDPAEQGHGIRGMRERAEALGGELTAEPVGGGGFVVTARLPLGDRVSSS